jgi:transposase
MDKPDTAFKAEALRLASESRSTQAARAPHIDPKMLYKWRQDALSTLPR